MSSRYRVAPALLVSFALTGCYTATFVASDSGYIVRPGSTSPQIFSDRRPEARYRVVGFVRVEADPAVSDASVRSAAISEGRRAGCQILIDKRLLSSGPFDRLRLALGAAALVAHEGDESRPTPSAGDHSGGGKGDESKTGGGRLDGAASGSWQVHEFACGIFE